MRPRSGSLRQPVVNCPIRSLLMGIDHSDWSGRKKHTPRATRSELGWRAMLVVCGVVIGFAMRSFVPGYDLVAPLCGNRDLAKR